MNEYIAPLRDMQFVLLELAPSDQLAALPDCEEVNLDLATASWRKPASSPGACSRH